MGKERFPGMNKNGMTPGAIARTILHMSAPIFLVYYLVPEDTWIGVSKSIVLLVVLIVVLLVELSRILFGFRFFGLREYEGDYISAYAWASFAFALAFLLFDFRLVVPVIFGMAWIDPMCGWLRRENRKMYPWIPLLAYAIMTAIILFLVSDFPVVKLVIFSLVGSAVATASEYPNLKHINDDFTMVMFPLIALTLAGALV
jgi:hypothetical protein